MRPGETLKGDNGYEVLLYPLPTLNITQVSGPSSYSHCCGHVIDVVGPTIRSPIYAPCTCRKTYDGPMANGHQQQFTSVDQVNYAGGVGFITFGFAHDTSNLYKVGDVIPQGKLIGYTGTAGGVADHSHLDVAIGANRPFVDSGITCTYQAQFGLNCWMIQNSQPPQNMWFVNNTGIVYTAGLSFRTYTGGIPGQIDPEGPDTPDPAKPTQKGMPLFMYLKQL